jgi:hypothetical protein
MAETIPPEGYSFEPQMRLHHLTGGLSLLVDGKGLSTLMSPGGPGMLFFSILPKMSVISVLAGQKEVRVLGRTQFDHAEEMGDPVTSNFVIAETNSNHQCLAYSQFHHWRGVATALHEMSRGADALLANRVGAQIRLCLAQLERLSIAYRTALSLTDQKPTTFSLKSDKYAAHVGSGIRSLLNELYSLRDALLAATFRLRYQGTDAYAIKKLKQLVMAEAQGVGKLISNSMFSEDGDLLIDRMSLYRAIAQHCIGDTNPIFGDVYQVCISSGPYGELPYLVYPLYDDIEKMRAIEKGASKGVLERPSREEAQRFLSLPRHLDALEFCYDCLVRLLRIAEATAIEIAIEPKVMTITDKDIIEATFSDASGKTTRVKRDTATGKLIEY